MNTVIPILTAVIALFFALTFLDQYIQRRRAYQLAWATALSYWFLGSSFQSLWEAGYASEAIFRSWYLMGAMLVPAYLGTGTLYLLAPRKVAHGFMGVVIVGTMLAFLLVMSATLQKPLDGLRPLSPEGEVLTGRGFFPFFPVVSLNIVLNTYGTVALVGGAIWSAASFARRRTMPYRVTSNILIAIGALVAAAGGTLDRFGIPEPHAMALLLGIVIIYIGFLRSQEVFQFYRFPFLGSHGAIRTP